ncbi:MAG: hypothetical protein APF77_01505 [Clostridia bacterium BRH_c25]|nr:MAG: hypothetical protein APF77_01505 [Clostridia bacterium BRH_c25]
MNEEKSIRQIRQELYEDVWSKPMTALTEKYGLSDNGIRKRCKSLNIPTPHLGYWAKLKAGKPVEEKPPLPPYDVTILSYSNTPHENDAPMLNAKKKTGMLERYELDEVLLEQLGKMHGLDLLTPSSLEIFTDWCNSLIVPGKIQGYHELISKHRAEIEYRKERDNEYPFRGDRYRIWKPYEKIKDRDNEAVLPINVSDKQQNRAYRIVDTILKALGQIKSKYSVERGDKDNINIDILGFGVTFELYECKTKRRHIKGMSAVNDFRPIYEEVFDGRLQMDWKISKYSHYCSDENTYALFAYTDSGKALLENQVPTMIFNIYKQCCNNEITYVLERRKQIVRYEQEEKIKLEQEEAEKRKKREAEKQASKNALINSIGDHANKWFMYEQLTKYADELEAHLATCENEETIQLLKEYIMLVRENAGKCNPLNRILQEMKAMESKEFD